MAGTMMALAAALLLAGPAAAAECVSVDKVKAGLARTFPGLRLAEIGGSEAKAFLAALNAAPPASAIAGDYLVIVHDVKWPAVFVVTFERGCAGLTFRLRRPLFRALMRTL